MALKFSTGYRNARLDGSGFKQAMAGCVLKLYTGPEPASADAAATGTKLVTYTKDGAADAGLELGTASGGSISKASGQTWSGLPTSSGTANYFRWEMPDDDGTLSGDAIRVQGKAGLNSDPTADLGLSSLAIVANAPQSIDSANITEPANS